MNTVSDGWHNCYCHGRVANTHALIILFRREKAETCVIEPVIEGPEGATFAPDTASISYFVGRYDVLVLTQGDKGGKDGMEAHVRDSCFPVVKAHGSDQRWEADGDFGVRSICFCVGRKYDCGE